MSKKKTTIRRSPRGVSSRKTPAALRRAKTLKSFAASPAIEGSPSGNPELMVVGDSLAQGVRSMSFRPDFAAQCVGARVAASQGWAFQVQKHPRPVLFDVEAEVRQLSLVGALFRRKLIAGICDRINRNFETWMQELVDSPTVRDVPPFDNLAVGGALIPDLLTPARVWRQFLRDNRQFRLNVDDVLDGNGLSVVTELFKAINFAYVLNPANKPEWEERSALSWLRERQPKRVLVSIGHNEALWDVGFLAKDQEVTIDQLQGLDAVAEALSVLDAEWVCWDLLPKVSAVANLDPVSTEWTDRGPGQPDNYCQRYQPVLSTGGSSLAGPRLQEIDRSIVTTNEAIQEKLRAVFTAAGHADRIRFFDDFAFFVEHDFKNQPDSEAPASRRLRVEFPYQNRTQRIDNRYLCAFYSEVPGTKPQGKFIPKVKQVVAGGIQSLDGMHPSAVGYVLKAAALTQQKDLGLKSIENPNALLAQAFEDDSLTRDFPTIVNTVRSFLRALQKFPQGSETAGAKESPPVQDEEHQCAVAWVRLMSSSMTA